MKTGKNGTIIRSKSPQPQTQPLPNGIVNPLSESNLVSSDHAQRLLVENSNLSAVDSDVVGLTAADKSNETNEENAGFLDERDVTPPSPLLLNPVISQSSLPSSNFINNHKTQTSFTLSSKFGEMKLKQEVSWQLSASSSTKREKKLKIFRRYHFFF